MDDIRASLERVRERVARAAERAGRRAEEVLLIGVSKTVALARIRDRKSTRLNSSHDQISYAVFCLKKKKTSTDLAFICARCTLTMSNRRVPVSLNSQNDISSNACTPPHRAASVRKFHSSSSDAKIH